MYTGGSDCSARLYDSNSGTLKRTCLGHTNAISALKVSDNQFIRHSLSDCKGCAGKNVHWFLRW